jgi:hypothetical protein
MHTPTYIHMPHEELWQVRGGVCSRALSADTTTADCRCAELSAADNGECFTFVAATLLSMHHASCNRSVGAPVLHHTACNSLRCNRQRANFKNVRCSQQACLPRKCTPHTAPQVNDYPMPMTPIAATAREMQANPPLEQTSQIASPEAR